MSTKPDTISSTIGRYNLTGVKVRGKWKFSCAAFPEIAQRYDGSDGACDAQDEFERLALQAKAARKKLAHKAKLVKYRLESGGK